MKELLAYLAASLKMKEDELTVDVLKKYNFVPQEDFTRLTDLSGKATAYEKEISTLKGDKTKLEESVQTLTNEKTTAEHKLQQAEPQIAFAKSYLDEQRKEAKRLYQLSMNGKGSAAFVSIIEKADDKELDAILQQYGGSVVKKLSGVCKNCQSQDIEFRSAIPNGDGKSETRSTPNHLATWFR